MKKVIWELSIYTPDDDVIHQDFKNKQEAIRKAPKVAKEYSDQWQDRNNDDYCFTLKKLVTYGELISTGFGRRVIWEDDFDIEGDWDVTPEGIFELSRTHEPAVPS